MKNVETLHIPKIKCTFDAEINLTMPLLKHIFENILSSINGVYFNGLF